MYVMVVVPPTVGEEVPVLLVDVWTWSVLGAVLLYVGNWLLACREVAVGRMARLVVVLLYVEERLAEEFGTGRVVDRLVLAGKLADALEEVTADGGDASGAGRVASVLFVSGCPGLDVMLSISVLVVVVVVELGEAVMLGC
jgi:hypothetical protein